MELILSDEEQEFLFNILEHRQQELLKEIAHTDRREFKQELRKNEQLLDRLIGRLRAVTAPEVRS
jgi:hypothetical protein